MPPPSCKVTRRTVLNTFVEEGGFTALCNYVSDINSNWFGFLNYEISILSAVRFAAVFHFPYCCHCG